MEGMNRNLIRERVKTSEKRHQRDERAVKKNGETQQEDVYFCFKEFQVIGGKERDNGCKTIILISD